MTESAGTTRSRTNAAAPSESLLLTVECHEHDGVRGRIPAEPGGDCHDRGGARRVVICTVVDLTLLHAEMIVVRRHEDDASGTGPSAHRGYHVGTLARPIGHGEALQQAGGEGVQPDRSKPLEHEGPGARPAGCTQAPTFHRIVGEDCDIGDETR